MVAEGEAVATPDRATNQTPRQFAAERRHTQHICHDVCDDGRPIAFTALIRSHDIVKTHLILQSIKSHAFTEA